MMFQTNNTKSIKENSFSLLGLELKCFRENELNRIIFSHIDSMKKERLLSGHVNLHALAQLQQNIKMTQYLESCDFHWIDGIPIIYMLKGLGFKIDRKYRLTFLDWQHSFFESAQKRHLKVFLLGSDERTIERASATLAERFPNIDFKCHHGFIKNINMAEKLISIENEFAPHIILIGMGMPLQEVWALENQSKLAAKVVIPIGGYFDYIAGKTYTPPRWLGPLGLEWLARLLSSPLRLSKRYFIEPIPVLLIFLKELLIAKFRKISL